MSGAMMLGVCRRLLGHEQDAEDAFQAVFLILARKAASIRQADVGGFLYRMAYRLALRARGQAAKRLQREQRVKRATSEDPAADVTWRELRQVMDEELQRLPEASRSALVLCYLEGKTLEEAAQLLGWSKSTLRRRLDQGREMLRRRLLKRGMAPMAALTVSLFAEESMATVPAALAEAVVRAAVSGTVPSALAALVEAGGALVSASKVKIVSVILLAVILTGGAGGWFLEVRTAKEPSERHEVSPLVGANNGGPTPRRSQETVEIRGRVLAPDGKPRSGAKLLLLDLKGHVKQLGVTAADGRFTVAVAKEITRHWDHWLLAQADGAALDFLELYRWKGDKPVELRLVQDHAIRGRVVNTEGKPLRGVRVAAVSIDVPTVTSLDSFLVAWTKRSFGSSIGCEKRFRTEGDAPLATTTDAEGRFTIQGAGVERLVSLHFSGVGIADEKRCIVNRAGFDPEPFNRAARDKIPKGGRPYAEWFLYGPNVSVVAEAEKPIHGVVTDADTGKPLPGVEVRGVNQLATTDGEGRYQIHGVRKAKSYTLKIASNPSTAYVASQADAADTAGYQPIRADLRVKKGVIITGKIIDQATGQSIPGFAAAAVLVNNPFVKEYPKLSSNSLDGDREYTDGDGDFRIVSLPGSVLLMVQFDYMQSTGNFVEGMKYADPVPDPKYPQYFQKPRNWLEYHAFDGGFGLVQGNFCKVLEIEAGTAVVHQDAVLRRAPARTVQIEDAEGRPFHGVWAMGIGSLGHRPVRIDEATCSAYSLNAGKPRLMVFYHPDKKLAGTLMLTGDEKQPAVVKLKPMASVKGRLLDLDGKPLAGVVVDLWYREPGTHFVHEHLNSYKEVVTDASGAFAFDKLVPEWKFNLSFHRRKQPFEPATKPSDPNVQVQSGECRDLGAIRLKSLPEKARE